MIIIPNDRNFNKKQPKVGITSRRGIDLLENRYASNIRSAINVTMVEQNERLLGQYESTGDVAEALASADEIRDVVSREIAAISYQSVTEWFNSVDQFALNKFTNAFKNALGVPVESILSQSVYDTIRGVTINANVGLIRDLADEQYLEVKRAILADYQGLGFPDGAKSLAGRIQDITNSTKRRASIIARDQTAKLNGNMTQARQEDAGVDRYQWRNAGDQRVVGNPTGLYPKVRNAAMHGNHWEREGKIFLWKEPPSDGHPGEPIMCIPGDSKVDFSYGCDKLWRRDFSGILINLSTSTGGSLEATPNHPILTSRGWLPIDEVQEGDYLVKSINNNVSMCEMHNRKFVSCIKDVFESCQHSIGSTMRIGSEFDFHGDGSKTNVDTIDIESFLSSNSFPYISEKIIKFLLSRSVHGTSASDVFFNGSGIFKHPLSDTLLREIGLSSSDMSHFGKFMPVLFARICHAYKHCIRTGSDGDIIILKDSSDSSAGDIEPLSDIFNAISLGIERDNVLFWKVISSVMRNKWFSNYGPASTPDGIAKVIPITPHDDSCISEGSPCIYQLLRVVKKSRCVFVGHVYNLQTDTGYYTSNGFFVKNCRCVAMAVFQPSRLNIQQSPVSVFT